MTTRTGTDEELMREAFQALLKGDTKTRDEICAQLDARIKAREAREGKKRK